MIPRVTPTGYRIPPIQSMPGRTPPAPKVRLGDYYSPYFDRFFPTRQWCVDELEQYDDGLADEFEKLYSCPEKFTYYYNQGLEKYEDRQRRSTPMYWTPGTSSSSSAASTRSYNPYGY